MQHTTSKGSFFPFNERNKLIDKKTLVAILKKYDYGCDVKDISFFHNAMVHKSYCVKKNEDFDEGNTNCPENCLPLQEESNERLEFLGDAVLNLIIGSYLFKRYFESNEGFLTKLRTKLVNGKMLAHLCNILNIKEWFIISKQNEENNCRGNEKFLEDMFEAFIGAMYLNADSSIEPVYRWLINFIEDNIDFAELIKSDDNHKDKFIKYYQQAYGYIPQFYEYGTETVNNQKIYTMCVKDKNGNIISKANGFSKKHAKNECAKLIMKSIDNKS